jgi:hypothetical protein
MKRRMVMQCGPCHRASGGRGLPSMAIANRPDIDDRGGLHGVCDGTFEQEHGAVHLDHLGEPFPREMLAQIQAKREKWSMPIGGHTLLRYEPPVVLNAKP